MKSLRFVKLSPQNAKGWSLSCIGTHTTSAMHSNICKFNIVERYDRILKDGSLVRIHQEETCQALGKGPGQKYQNDGGPSAAWENDCPFLHLFADTIHARARDCLKELR